MEVICQTKYWLWLIEFTFKVQEKIGENGEMGPFNVIAINMDQNTILKYRGTNDECDEIFISYIYCK